MFLHASAMHRDAFLLANLPASSCTSCRNELSKFFSSDDSYIPKLALPDSEGGDGSQRQATLQALRAHFVHAVTANLHNCTVMRDAQARHS